MHKKYASLPLVLVIGLVIDLVIAIPVMLIWNNAIASTFALPTLTYMKTFAIMIMIDLIRGPDSSEYE